jgi:hypothetical protein
VDPAPAGATTTSDDGGPKEMKTAVTTAFAVKNRLFVELDKHACASLIHDGQALQLEVDEQGESVTLRPIVKRGDDIDVTVSRDEQGLMRIVRVTGSE